MKKIVELINKGLQDGDFSGPADINKVNLILSSLGVSLPKTYKWFQQRYGHGGIGGLEILGVTKGEVPSCVIETERFRKLGLPPTYVVVENCDEWIFCLDTSKMKDDECPVC